MVQHPFHHAFPVHSLEAARAIEENDPAIFFGNPTQARTRAFLEAVLHH
jgi:ABC-type polar amino acid transport system ATPase subunit